MWVFTQGYPHANWSSSEGGDKEQDDFGWISLPLPPAGAASSEENLASLAAPSEGPATAVVENATESQGVGDSWVRPRFIKRLDEREGRDGTLV